jgi:hypothetical protein
MPDKPQDKLNDPFKGVMPKQNIVSDEPGFVDGIPVEELVALTRKFITRINNEDRQRLTQELSDSGRTIQTGAPAWLQQFYTGKIDLDLELMRRYPSAPLMSSSDFTPEPGKRAKRGVAQLKSQDEAAVLNIDVQGIDGTLEATFILRGMIGIRFALGSIADASRQRFLDLMRRQNGIAVLWTKERWERDYLIFVVRERFARVYAFSPSRYEAAVRFPPTVLDEFVRWLSAFWVSDGEIQASEPRLDVQSLARLEKGITDAPGPDKANNW